MPLVDKSSKGRHITFEDEEVETNIEEYVFVTEDEIGTDVRKEKSRKRPKVTMPKNVSVLVNDENFMRKKSKVKHSQVVIINNENPREIITPGVDLE